MSWGNARQGRFTELSLPHGADGGWPDTGIERSDALRACVAEAWQSACRQLRASSQGLKAADPLNGLLRGGGLADLLIALRGLVGSDGHATAGPPPL